MKIRMSLAGSVKFFSGVQVCCVRSRLKWRWPQKVSPCDSTSREGRAGFQGEVAAPDREMGARWDAVSLKARANKRRPTDAPLPETGWSAET